MTDNTIQESASGPDDRRGFLKKASAIVIGGVVTVVPFIAGLLTWLDPLRRKAGVSGFLRVAPFSAVPEDGSPGRFQILADREDAWNKFPNVPVGAVFLRRIGEGRVEALHSTCPHAGCPVGFINATGSFLCPCHDSKFNLDGSLADPANPSPRAMDTLEVELREGGTEVWVKFQNFEVGKARKIPVA